MGEEPEITKTDIYQSLPNLVTNAENISWARFNTFLVANSIIILAWIAIYTTKDIEKKFILLSILASLGSIGGLFWAGLGIRGRNNVSRFLDIGKRIESQKADADKEQYKNILPFTEAIDERDKGNFSLCGSRFILSFAPIAFSIFHTVLLYLSLASKQELQISFISIMGTLIIVVIVFVLKAINKS